MGHSDASGVFSAIVRIIESDCFQLPCEKLVGLASVICCVKS